MESGDILCGKMQKTHILLIGHIKGEILPPGFYQLAVDKFLRQHILIQFLAVKQENRWASSRFRNG